MNDYRHELMATTRHDALIIYRRIHFKKHSGPFSKSMRGKARRVERHHVIERKTSWLEANNHGA